jgi:hypothetical protein
MATVVYILLHMIKKNCIKLTLETNYFLKSLNWKPRTVFQRIVSKVVLNFSNIEEFTALAFV